MRGARHCGVHSKRLASRGSASRPLSAEAWSSWRSVSRRWRALAAMVCVVRPLKATTHDVSPCRRRLHASCCAHVGWTRPRVGSVLRPRQTDRPSGPREVKQRTSRNRALVQTAESDASYCTEDMLVAAYQPIETNVLQHQMAVREWAAVYAVSSPFTLLARLSREIAVPTPTAPRRRQTWGGRRSAVRAAKNAAPALRRPPYTAWTLAARRAQSQVARRRLVLR